MNGLPFAIKYSTVIVFGTSAREALDCFFDEFRRCLGHDVESEVSSGSAIIADEAIILMGVKSLLEDMCNTSSRLYKIYSENYQCLQDVLNGTELLDMCGLQAAMWYQRYKDGISRGSDKSDFKCLLEATVLGCISENVTTRCGDEAGFFVVEEVHRNKFLKLASCTPQQILQLQNSYLFSLNLESSRRRIYQRAFDL
ncbi:uncharacterized protein [Parasteatoda tepidariorum]|uniref:uncharacterized protein n=1 Tax=Parasteatoda tepidariorum TaxID=114398 RepID=UPI0039BC4AEA